MSKPLTEITTQEFDNRIGSLVGGLFIFYLLLSGNFTGELLNCQFQNILRNSSKLKHVVGFLMLFFFVNLASTNVNWNAGIKLGLSLVLFLFFILSNRCEGYIVLINIILLAVIYFLQSVRDTDQNIINDEKSSEDDKKTAQKEIDTLRIVQIITTVVIMILIVFGFILYVGRRKLEYGKQFKYTELLFSTECANDYKNPYTYKQMLKAAFAQPSDSPDIGGTVKIASSLNLFPTKLSPVALIQKSNDLAALLNSPLIRKQLKQLQANNFTKPIEKIEVVPPENPSGDIGTAYTDTAPLLQRNMQNRRNAAYVNFGESPT